MNNTPAFPRTQWPNETGMTLRDYFAAKALQGMCANSNDDHNPYEMEYEDYAIIIAKSAYQLADAMLEARK